ncbi:MAG: cyclase family protein [Solirubrobacteraceae bacterium]
MSAAPVSELIRGLAFEAVEVVDLTQPLSESTPVIELPEPYVNSPGLSRRELARYDARNPLARWDVLELGEHTGTHLDAPIHWITGRDGDDIASIAPGRLVGPAVVIDKSAEAAKDPGYLLTVADLEAFEAAHGEIPAGAWVLLQTGWDERAADRARFLNVGRDGPVTPGPDVDACRWLADARAISGFGTETVGPDAGAAGGFEPPWPAHHYLLGAGRCTVSSLANLARLPPIGALIVVAPLKLVDGTGSPARVLAFVPARTPR